MYKYQRLLENVVSRLARPKECKIIALLGNRQVGKTTLMDHFASHWQGKVIRYVGDKLEDALLWRGKFSELKNRLEIDLKETLENLERPCLLIFDEIQKIPEAFNNLKVLQDQYKSKLRIAISGSSSLSLLSSTSESLGGRVELTVMYPLSFLEILNRSTKAVWLNKSTHNFILIKEEVLNNSGISQEAENNLAKALEFGCFPEAFLLEDKEEAKILYQNYHQTYIEKDIRNLNEVGNALDFDLVWKIAHRSCGQILKPSNISKETGLAFNTVKKYVSVLQASYNIQLLHAYTRNIRSRLVKSSKIFSQDVGYFNHCLDLFNKESLIASGLIGRVFESLMVMEFFKQERSFLMGGDPYFFRTSGGAEVDLVVEKGEDIFAYEFKYSERVAPSDFSGLKSLQLNVGKRFKVGFVVSRQPYAEKIEENLFAVPWWYFCI